MKKSKERRAVLRAIPDGAAVTLRGLRNKVGSHMNEGQIRAVVLDLERSRLVTVRRTDPGATAWLSATSDQLVLYEPLAYLGAGERRLVADVVVEKLAEVVSLYPGAAQVGGVRTDSTVA